jgi:hypothetical protein
MKLRVAVLVLLCALLTSFAVGQQKPPENLQPLIDQLDKTAAELVKDPNAASFTKLMEVFTKTLPVKDQAEDGGR